MKVGSGTPGPGRPKGSKNKTTALLKDMILKALDEAGGVAYLVEQARENPGAFLTLVGKVLPLEVSGPDGDLIHFSLTLNNPEALTAPKPSDVPS